MRYWFDMIWHYFSSNSRHGTHSPFVYKLADELIYKKRPNFSFMKAGVDSENLMCELIDYLQLEMIKSPSQVYVTDANSLTSEELVVLQNIYPVIFVKDIYINHLAKRKWAIIKQDPSVVVTIDLFYFGIMINRNEQPKENFKLRFPYFKY